MRSSKSRSRGNKNRNNRPSGGNIINRVFDSSGPDGKVRGTPQQIIEKYNQLHRDAQLSGDRVAAENFAQHAEYYTRLLSEAQSEVDRLREEQEEQNRQRQAERDRERNERLKAQEDASGGDSQGGGQTDSHTGDHTSDPEASGQGSDSTLVATPEGQHKPRRPRAPRQRKPKPEAGHDGGGDNAPNSQPVNE